MQAREGKGNEKAKEEIIDGPVTDIKGPSLTLIKDFCILVRNEPVTEVKGPSLTLINSLSKIFLREGPVTKVKGNKTPELGNNKGF